MSLWNSFGGGSRFGASTQSGICRERALVARGRWLRNRGLRCRDLWVLQPGGGLASRIVNRDDKSVYLVYVQFQQSAPCNPVSAEPAVCYESSDGIGRHIQTLSGLGCRYEVAGGYSANRLGLRGHWVSLCRRRGSLAASAAQLIRCVAPRTRIKACPRHSVARDYKARYQALCEHGIGNRCVPLPERSHEMLIIDVTAVRPPAGQCLKGRPAPRPNHSLWRSRSSVTSCSPRRRGRGSPVLSDTCPPVQGE